MAIDVQAEAKGIAEAYQPSVVDPTMLAADITSLVTRAVADARREQDIALRDDLCDFCKHMSITWRDGENPCDTWDKRPPAQTIRAIIMAAMMKAKREQMEDDCKAVCAECDNGVPCHLSDFKHKDNFYTHGPCIDEPGRFIWCDAHPIRAAFAAKGPRDAAKDDARQRFDHAAVELRQYLGMGTLDMAAKFGPDFDPDEYAKGLAESFDSAARELGLDGAA